MLRFSQLRVGIAGTCFGCGALITAVLLISIGASAQPSSARVMGTVKSVSGNSVVVTQQDGSEATVTFADSARIIRAVPGQTDLKTAPSIPVSDIQVGDHISAHGQSGAGNLLTARFALVMKESDIVARQQREREEWRRGVGGIVKEVNAADKTLILNNAFAAQGKPIVVHITPQTEIRRYSPKSISYDDSTPGTFDQIKPGDQLSARGTKSTDGMEFTAQAIVSGAFQNIAGTIISTDARNNTVTLTDLATKQPLMVKIEPDSQLRKLPPFIAMGMAMRLKGGMPGGAGAPGAQGAGEQRQWQGGGQGQWRRPSNGGTAGPGAPGEQSGGFHRNGGPPDFQEMLNRMPAVNISDLNKGDAVILVATAASEGSEPTVIKLLTGVEPILTAAPAGTNAAATVLSPWNLGQSPAGGGDASAGP
jgi:hypothetical protein